MSSTNYAVFGPSSGLFAELMHYLGLPGPDQLFRGLSLSDNEPY
jgi:hypothetical protein